MNQIRKVGDVYYIEFFARGLLYTLPAGTNYQDAEKLLKLTQEKIATGEALIIPRTIELAHFYEQFIEDLNGVSVAKTVWRFKDLISHFKSFLLLKYPQLKHLSDITPEIVESYKTYLKQQNLSVKKINFSLLLLRDMLEYGIKIGFLNDNPSVHLKLFPMNSLTSKQTPRYLKAKDFFSKQLGLLKISQLLNVSDVAKLMYYSNLIPLTREDMYN